MFLERTFQRLRFIACLALVLVFFVGLTNAQDLPPEERTLVRPTTAISSSSPRALEDLSLRISDILRRPELAPAQIALKVLSLDTGRVIYEENAGKLLLPASVMKVFTVAAALDRLSPDFRFKTSVYAPSVADAAGTIRGDLIIYGRGDPSFSASFNSGDYYRAINELAASIVAAGVRRIEGDLVGDESYFSGSPYGFAWGWDVLQWYYGAEVSALSVNDNSLDLFVRPGSKVGDRCVVTTGPPAPLLQIVNRATTGARGSARDLRLYRPIGQDVLEITGALPLGDRGFNGIIAAPKPALSFVYMLRAALAKQGVTITGKSRSVDARAREVTPINLSALTEIASRQSPPFSEIASKALKPSQNLYTELILRTLGAAASTDPKLSSEEAGALAVRAFLQTAGINPNEVIMADGSGLSRRDLVTPNSVVQLLDFMSRHRYRDAFREALPVAGVDGTLNRRLIGTSAANNLRGKTGTIEGVATLAGYVTAASGERLVFAIFVNNYPDSSTARRTVIDDIAILLASFTGRT